MPVQTGIKVEGLNQTIRNLKQLETPNAELQQAGFDAAQIVVNQAKQPGLVPVRTGKLRGSLRPAKIIRGAAVIAGNAGKLSYANPIHWGWYKRGIKPNPFIYRALGMKYEQVMLRYEANIAKLAAKANKPFIPHK